MQDSDDSFWKDEPSLFDDPQAIAAADERAANDIANGRLIGHQAVLYWLRSWGENPPPLRTPWDG